MGANPPTIVKNDSKSQLASPAMVEMQPNKKDRGKALRQVLAAFVANLGTINTGLTFGFSAVVLPQLKAADSLIKIDDNQATWIGKNNLFFIVFFLRLTH